MADTVEMQDSLVAGCVRATHVSLHLDHPGSTGANELSGGNPAYARLPITWDAAPATPTGVRRAVPTGVFNLPPNTTVQHLGFWDGDTYLDSTPMVASSVEQDRLQINEVLYRVLSYAEASA